MNSSLLLIDLQNDFFENGSLAVPHSNHIIDNINILISHFKSNGKNIIASLDWHPKNHQSFASTSQKEIGTSGILHSLPQIWWPNHCIQYSYGAKLHHLIDKEKIDYFVFKGENPKIDSYSAFFDNGHTQETDLNFYLQTKKITTLFVCGLATDYCVKYTILDALQLNYQVFFIKDASEGVNLNFNDTENTIKLLEKKGAVILKTEEIPNMNLTGKT